MDYELAHIDSIFPDPSNVRLHPERNIEAIKSSLARFGQQKPLVVDAKGIIRAGNGTYAAAKALGWTKITVVRSELAGSEATAYAIADNRTAELAAWDDIALAETLRALQSNDYPIEVAGFTDAEVDELLAGLADEIGGGLDGAGGADDPGTQVDRAEELQAKWKVRRGQLWEIPSATVRGKAHRLLCGDSTKVEDVGRLMEGEKAVLIVTDPPYGVEFIRGQFITDKSRISKTNAPASIQADNRKDEEQRAFIAEVFRAYASHIEAGAVVYMFSAALKEGCQSYFGMMDAGIHVQSQLIWNKNNHILGQADYHWKHEVCWYGWYDTGSHKWYGGRDKFTVIDCARVSATLHPNEKPTAIVEDFLDNSSLGNEVVVDPFGGSGTTLVACETKGRVCRAMELDPKFAACILERLSGLGLSPRPVV